MSKRIRRDAEHFAGDAEMIALFGRLEARVFDADLDLTSLLATFPRDVRDRFAETLAPPKGYVDECRIAAAVRLVRETDADLRDVAREVGYDVPRTFRRAFHRVTGTTASKMRRQARAMPDDSAPRIKYFSPASVERRVSRLNAAIT